MASDEIRRLIGGYATGTLSAAQCKLLFEAALDDQELFDELARDQALKDLLEAPGVKQRLLASLQSLDGDAQPERVWWKHPLPWAMATFALAVSVLLLAVVYFTPSGSRKVEVAQNTVPSSSSTRAARPAPVAAESPAPPESPNEPKPDQAQTRQRTGNGTTPPAPSEPPPPPQLQNEPNAPRGVVTAATGAANRPATVASPSQPARDAVPAVDKDSQVAENALKKSAAGDSKALDAVGAVGALAAPVGEQRAAAPAGLGGVPPAASSAAPGQPALAPRAMAVPPAPRAMTPLAAPAKLAPAGPLAFDYSIHDGVLRVVPATDGYMIVKATVGTTAAGEDRLLLRTSHVIRTSPLVLSIPEGTASLLLVISSRPVSEDSVGDLAARSVPRTELAGTVSNTNGATPLAASARLEVRIRLR